MQQTRIFRIEKFGNWDLVTILIYLITTVIIYTDLSGMIGREMILFYAYTAPSFLYLFNYKALRNIYIWIYQFQHIDMLEI